MTGNGVHLRNEERLLRGAAQVDPVVPILQRAAAALTEVARALNGLNIERIGADTAKALSETTEIRRHLANITAREQSIIKERDRRAALLGAELAELHAKYDGLKRLIPKRVKRKIKAKRAKRR